MTRAGWKYAFAGILVAMVFGTGSIAAAQTNQNPWSVEFGLGWDNDITGDIIAGGIGQINGQNVVMTKSTYEDVYGTGLHLKGGVGYMLHSKTELRVDARVPVARCGHRHAARRHRRVETVRFVR